MDFARYAVQLTRQIFNCGLHEQGIRQPAFCRLAMNLFRELDQLTRIRVNSDEKLVGVLASAQTDKAPIAGSNIDNPALAIRRDQILKGASIELIEFFATDDFQHWIILYFPEFTYDNDTDMK